MTISFQVLGTSGRDNAVFVSIDSGQSVDRLLFDCGENCLSSLAISEIQAIDHVLFSHFHMTSVQVAETARRAQVQELILFHVSDRYIRDERSVLLEEARVIFPQTHFPAHWSVGS